MRRFIGALLVLMALAAPAAAQTVTLNEPATKADWVFGGALSGTTSNIAVSGGWTGTQPTQIACQIYKKSDLSVVQAYTNLSPQSVLGGGTWSGTLNAPWHAFEILIDCKDNGLGTTSAKNSRTFLSGITFVIDGQSQEAREYQASGECATATMTAGANTTISVASCVTPDQTLYGAWINGLTAFSCNFTGGDCSQNPPVLGSGTITNGSPNSFKISGASVLATGTFDVQVEIQTPAHPVTGCYRLQNSTAGPQPVGGAKVGSESVSADPAAGEIDFCTRMQAAFNGGDVAVMIIDQAVGGTLASQHIQGPPVGTYYTSAQQLFGSSAPKAAFVSSDFFALGGTDTLPANNTPPATFAAQWLDIGNWIKALTGTPVFMVPPLGVVNEGGATDVEVDAIRQVHYSCIDNTANCFFGGIDQDCEHVQGGSPVHLSEKGKTTCYNPRQVQALLRQSGKSTHGYGPKLDPTSGKWNGVTQFTVKVLPEVVGDTLTSAGLSASGANLTGFRILDNGNGGALLTISSTSFTQPATIVLNTSTTPTCPCVLDYLYGAAPPVTNLVYSNFPVPSDVNGLPLQHSRAPGIAMVNTSVAGTGSGGGRRPFH